MEKYKDAIDTARKILGSFDAVGVTCGVSGKAVMKWRKKGCPPRTEYTGETDYAASIVSAVTQKGGVILRNDLVPIISPQVQVV